MKSLFWRQDKATMRGTVPVFGVVRKVPALCAFALLLAGCGRYPEPLASARDIARLPADTEMIAITDLPVEDYPLLAKFQKLRSIDYYKEGRSGATDAKLEALSRLDLPNLRDIELLAATAVTDRGIEALIKLPSLRGLVLEGTSM